MRPIRIGVIGIGFGQQVHVPALRLCGAFEVCAIAASEESRAKPVAERLGIPRAYGDAYKLVDDPDVEAISIATPPAAQAEIALAAIERAKPVFLEKPVAIDAVAALRLANEAKLGNVPAMVDFELPELDPWRAAREMLDEGRIGELRHLVVNWAVETRASRLGLDSWKTRVEDGGGVLHNFVSHVLHYVEWLAGPALRLRTENRSTAAVLSLELASGAHASVIVDTAACLGSGHRIEIYGSEGALRLENGTSGYMDGFRLWHGTRDGGRLEPIGTPVASAAAGEDDRIAPVARIMARFADWIRTGSSSPPGLAEGLRVARLLDASLESHRRGVPVDLPPGGATA